MTCVIWNLALVCLETLLVLVEDICARFAPNAPKSKKPFWKHLLVLQVKRLKWRLDSVYLEIVLILMQDRCTVCMERTMCLEINLDAPDRTS